MHVDSGLSTTIPMLAVAVLAAGKGTRMKSSLPKVLQPLAGSTLIERVLRSFSKINPDRCFLIVGHQGEQVKENLDHLNGLEFVLQNPQNGTGHAVQQLIPLLKDFDGELLVLNGDVPLLREKTIKKLVDEHRARKAKVTFLSSRVKDPTGYGRVFSDDKGLSTKIVEHRDCTEKELLNNLTNAGIYCFNWKSLAKVLPNLKGENEQKELYITDTVAMVMPALHLEVDDPGEVSGINNRQQLAQCEELLQERLRQHWMNEGVTFIDPSSCTLSEGCLIGRDVIIEPQTHLRGNCIIGDESTLGPGTLIQDSSLGRKSKVTHSVISQAQVGDDVSIGPFANIRPGTNIENNCRIGNFVEVKKSQIGTDSKINHLSYIGDASLGEKVNIGAGTITANFDGVNKHRTVIGPRSKTGANSVLVAPIVLGRDVTVGAGSTLTRSVPDFALAISRAKQLTKEGWSKLNINTH